VALTKRTKNGIAALIFVFAFLTAYWNNRGVISPYNAQEDFSKVEHVFDYSDNNSKLKIEMSVSDLQKNQAAFNNLLALRQIIHNYHEVIGNQEVYLLEIPSRMKNYFVNEAGKVGRVVIAKEITSVTENDPNLDTKLADFKLIKQQLMDDISKRREASDYKITRIKDLQATIDSLTYGLQTREHNRNMSLIYLILTDESSQRANLIQSLIAFFQQGFLYVLLYTAIAVGAYYGSRILVVFLSLMGVKGSSGSGTYRYGGGKYGYGYGYSSGSNRKRKIKRIYKGNIPKEPDGEDDTTPK
jgi:hypothetical protein